MDSMPEPPVSTNAGSLGGWLHHRFWEEMQRGDDRTMFNEDTGEIEGIIPTAVFDRIAASISLPDGDRILGPDEVANRVDWLRRLARVVHLGRCTRAPYGDCDNHLEPMHFTDKDLDIAIAVAQWLRTERGR
jgi:hypothetical protein